MRKDSLACTEPVYFRHVQVHQDDLVLNFAASLLAVPDEHVNRGLPTQSLLTLDPLAPEQHLERH